MVRPAGREPAGRKENDLVVVLRSTFDRFAPRLWTNWMDTPRLIGGLAQPTHFCFAKHFLLPLTRNEVVAHHWWHLFA